MVNREASAPAWGGAVLNSTDFDEFARHHAGNFPQWAVWARELTNRIDARQSWQRMLADVELADACWASDAMACGTISKPFEKDSVIPVIAQEARRRSEKREQQKPAYFMREAFKCVRCRDRGLCEVFSPKTIREVKKGLLDDFIEQLEALHEQVAPWVRDDTKRISQCLKEVFEMEKKPITAEYRNWKTVMIRCSCEAGRAYRLPDGAAPLPWFDEKSHYWADPTKRLDEHLRALKDFNAVPANYVADFDEWNAQASFEEECKEVGF